MRKYKERKIPSWAFQNSLQESCNRNGYGSISRYWRFKNSVIPHNTFQQHEEQCIENSKKNY